MLDTHYLIWLATERHKLTAAERQLIEMEAETLSVSALSIWELRLKWRKAEAKAISQSLLTPQAALAFITESPINLEPLDGSTFGAALDPPLDHGDPFDEMLLVHAQQSGARLLTRDARLRGHPLALHS
jgi:PIN domain nuclease of toxin-antitoxin system